MIIVTNDTVLGKNLKFLREKKGLSLIEMAGLIDMEVNRLEQLEEGHNFEIHYLSLKKVYDMFEGDMDHLFDTVFE